MFGTEGQQRSGSGGGPVPATAGDDSESRDGEPALCATESAPDEVTIGLSVVMPVYDEAATVAAVLDRVLARDEVDEVIVVDDGSTDGTAAVLETFGAQPRVRVVHHERNRGKGAALRTGFEAARGDLVLVQDADLEYHPEDYPRLLAPFADPAVQVVYGSRFLEHNWRRGRLHHRLGNRFLTFCSNLCNGQRLTDMETCYKVLRRSVLERLELRSERFTIEPEITHGLARLGIRIHEVPIRYDGRGYGAGKKIGWRDGVAALWTIVRLRFGR